jgi:hypothetical protein
LEKYLNKTNSNVIQGNKNMKQLYTAFTLVFLIVATQPNHAQTIIASDNAGDAAYNSGWTAGSDGGTGFGAWSFNHSQGSGGAGIFIGNPALAGISGMSTNSFGFYANPLGSGANAEVSRSFDSAMAVGNTFSFLWGLNFDSNDANSNRGFNLRSGATQLININMANSAAITINGSPLFSQYGTQAFTLNFTYESSGNIRVAGIGRDGTEAFNQVVSVAAGAPDNFVFYFNATDTDAGDNRQMYLNNLQIIPEPSTPLLIGLGLAGLLTLRKTRKT